MNNKHLWLPAFMGLLEAELIVVKKLFWRRLIDILCMAIVYSAVSGYILPAFGASPAIGLFMAAGMSGSSGFFGIIPNLVTILKDLTGDKVINFGLALPMPAWLVVIKQIVAVTITGLATGVFILPITKLVLWNSFDLSHFSLVKYLVIMVMSNLFFAAAAVALASATEQIEFIDTSYRRIMFPLWQLGGFQFSWKMLWGISTTLAYASLINPFFYIFEPMRTALLGDKDNLPFWPCIGVLALITACVTWYAVRSLKKRLDWV